MSVTPEEAQMEQFLASRPPRKGLEGKVVQVCPASMVTRFKGWLGVVVEPLRSGEDGWWVIRFNVGNPLTIRNNTDLSPDFTTQNIHERDLAVIGDLLWTLEVWTG